MRESKYRAWDKEDKRMIVDKQDFIPLIITNLGVMKLDPTSKENRWILLPRERFVLMQFIGLKDKNGVEIFEGDICRMSAHDKGRVIEHTENTSTTCGGHGCYYDTWFSGYSIDGYYGDLKDIEIIGNVHEVSE